MTTPRTDNEIHLEIKKNPFLTSTRLQLDLLETSRVSRRTIRRRLKDEFGLPARKPVKKPHLTAFQMKRRYNFAKKYAKWTKQEWEKVIFSDESMIVQFESTGWATKQPQYSSDSETQPESDGVGLFWKYGPRRVMVHAQRHDNEC